MSPSPEMSPQAGAHAGQAQISVTLRYFAAAAEAAGRPEERLVSGQHLTDTELARYARLNLPLHLVYACLYAASTLLLLIPALT